MKVKLFLLAGQTTELRLKTEELAKLNQWFHAPDAYDPLTLVDEENITVSIFAASSIISYKVYQGDCITVGREV
jgi:hypothetical protein